MAKYILKRLLLMIPIIIGVSFLVFFIMSLTPGFDDPARIILGMDASKEAVENLNTMFGANKPFFIRYFDYISDAIQGDFGVSYRTQQPVAQEIMRRFPTTLKISLISIILSLIIGIPLGIVSAVKQYTATDYFSRLISMLMTAIPSFWLGLMLLLLFSLQLRWLPSSGVDTWKGYILPSVSLSIISMGLMIRMTRSTMLEVIRQDYIRTARSKGVPEKTVVFKHALRNALIPVVTVAGTNFGAQLGGAVIIEAVFAVPGVGQYVLNAVNTRDLPGVLSSVILLAVTFSLINLTVDVIYSFIDPRIKSIHGNQERRRQSAESGS